MLPFSVVGGGVVRDVVRGSRAEIVEVVRDAYLTHAAGRTANPHSQFLRFPEKPEARIIALPAYLGGDYGVAGIKWVASFPGNIAHNLPRASAVLLLNDYETGYPFACLEASEINAARTAALAAIAAEELAGGRSAGTVAVVGAGVIARTVVEFLAALGWTPGRVVVHDTVGEYAGALADHVRGLGWEAGTAATAREAIDGADLVVLATTAPAPYLTEPGTFAPGQNVLNISLRDIGPEIVAASHNVLDDVDHCLTANTSPHLAEQRYGHRGFVDGTLADLMLGGIRLGDARPRIYSPFGLGVLDLAVGLRVYEVAVRDGRAAAVDDFFAAEERWPCLVS